MRLTARRLIKLEMAYKALNKDHRNEAIENDFRDWIINDPQAKELIEREYKYCISKGYPILDMDTIDFYDRLQDPEFDKMNRESLDAFDKYLKTRRAV